MPCGEAAHEPPQPPAAVRNHPTDDSREREDDERDGNTVDNEHAHGTEEFAAVQKPDGAEERHLAVVAFRLRQSQLPETPVRRHGKIHVRPSRDHKAVATQGDVAQLFLLTGQRHFMPTLVGMQTIQSILSERKENARRRDRHSANLAEVSPSGQPFVEVGERRGGAVGLPDSAVPVGQYASLPPDGAPQQSPVPMVVQIVRRQNRPADVDSRKDGRMVQHQSRQGKHDNEESQHQSEPLVVLAPNSLFHLSSRLKNMRSAVTAGHLSDFLTVPFFHR